MKTISEGIQTDICSSIFQKAIATNQKKSPPYPNMCIIKLLSNKIFVVLLQDCIYKVQLISRDIAI